MCCHGSLPAGPLMMWSPKFKMKKVATKTQSHQVTQREYTIKNLGALVPWWQNTKR
jgi:hypothetical protein